MADDAAAPEGELSEVAESSADSPESTAEEATESPQASDPDVDVAEDALADIDADDASVAVVRQPMSRVKLATILGLVTVLALGGLVGWLGWRAQESHEAEQQRALFVQVGKQAALNLTTIDFEHADDDVKRILDSAGRMAGRAEEPQNHWDSVDRGMRASRAASAAVYTPWPLMWPWMTGRPLSQSKPSAKPWRPDSS